MLLELTIQDFAIIDHVHLHLERGLNVMTGETGAGKSIIIDAVSLLLGGRANTDVVRSGSDRAQVEGLFALDTARLALIRPLLEENGLLTEGEEETLMIRRDINANGRTVCRINGHAIPATVLKTIAAPLVDIHGQSEHLSLMNPRKHVDLLDRFAGTLPLRAQFAEQVAKLRAVRDQMTRLAKSSTELAHRTERLTFIVEEIESADLEVEEEETLNQERKVLSNSEKLAQMADEICAILSEGVSDDQPPVTAHTAHLLRTLTALAKVDETMDETLAQMEQAHSLLDDIGRTLNRYRDTLEFNPARLEEIERRLAQIFNLKRKYGADIATILQTLADSKQELEDIAHAEIRLAQLHEEEQVLLKKLGESGVKLTSARKTAAAKMSETVVRELADLRMERAQFQVNLQWLTDPQGAIVTKAGNPKVERRVAFDSTGLDQVEFLLAPNPGEGLKPLARIASGGEASRIMLAIKTALGQADDTPTLIFDEIDTGVGGRVGSVVGQKLHALADARQVLCITHLPQLAAYGDKHFHIRKELTGNRTRTRVTEMSEEERVGELAQMIGTGEAARTAAEELRAQVKQHANGR
jgi:DNA repair protein RecN (Recombination protein N)